MFKYILAVLLTATEAFAEAPKPKAPDIQPPAATLGVNSSANFLVKIANTPAPANAYSVAITNPDGTAPAIQIAFLQSKGELRLVTPSSLPDNSTSVPLKVTISDTASHLSTDVKLIVTKDDPTDWDARAIVGFHQAGASSADSEQNFFFDFYVNRPLMGDQAYTSRLNLWGDVRVASAPQQITAPVSQFVAGFADAAGNVPVNKLALGGEFLTGFEVRVWDPRYGSSKIRTLGFVGFFGANGAFSDPVSRARVFKAVSKASPQWPNFLSQFPQYAGPNGLDPDGNGKYLALVPPDRERFYREYGAGLRYTAYRQGTTYVPPEMYTVTVGQDQSITGGRYRGAVLKLDAFYPIPLKLSDTKSMIIYLFGTANLAIARPVDHTPLAMQLVSNPCAAGEDATKGTCGVVAYADNVVIAPIPSARDTYRMGMGIDLLALAKMWMPK